MEPYKACNLPLEEHQLDVNFFLDELIEAVAKLEVYKVKLADSKLSNEWFLPTLQAKEAVASSKLEGTQATLDDVLVSKVKTNDRNDDLSEILNYFEAANLGFAELEKKPMTIELINKINCQLLGKPAIKQAERVGKLRTGQNYIRRLGGSLAVTYVPPIPEEVPGLMNNLIAFINDPRDLQRPLVRIAIIHAQFLTIHPYMDGNGRVGRILIPLLLYLYGLLDKPYFMISEALEKDKTTYYSLLTNVRYKGEWNQWIRYFLGTIAEQCIKYIEIIDKINLLYEQDLKHAGMVIKSSKLIDLMNLLYEYPAITVNKVAESIGISPATANRYLAALSENRILNANNKSRNKVYFYDALFDILR